ncbi:uncharacterized protein MONOS_8752 [Monocercomonoides exilis]|uniref:uncharacterized protein n=1 Tax=Monocercomonoides exilis TaxID=2049356 RepID=UPI003559A30C|nr:hypothetical protein MONOS_8752 [Monocercomonoides exilis]|eukprot:MONOS_8752.1-p1 / transcript=MONOS_8752.1 / gene=MONOS_8752 / organism=Monocercomonoides_exilis_PA203 / gene_product=unspecified product / transcript_product=unspecified product / location=Mono_scaffold00338:53957-54262(-) / protein_length=102 / sequence_SO=supercontig / SO=protein_coding / is_pseudo=false
MEDVVLSPAAIVLNLLEEGKEKEKEEEVIKRKKEAKRMSGLVEQLQEKDKIIWMSLMIILELNEKYNAEVKELQEQLVAMKEMAALIDVGIEKEKSRTWHD